MIASRTSKTFALSSLVALGLLAGMTPAVGTETLTTTPVAPAEATDPPGTPSAPVEEPAPLPSPSPSAATSIERTVPVEGTTADLGLGSARMGQGLARMAETGNAQVPTTRELDGQTSGETIKGGAAASPDGLVAPQATTWRPAGGVLGVDVSNWQGKVDWPAVWANGARFAYVKATEGNYYVSDTFVDQYSKSYAQGFIRGAYHFAIPSNSSGASQADYFVARGGGWTADGRTLPPLLDFEYNPYDADTLPSGKGDTCYGMSAAQLVGWVRDFSNRMVVLTGTKPMIYTTAGWWNYCTNNSTALSDHSLHVAHYQTTRPALPAGWGSYNVWQYTDHGPVVGDWNHWNGSMTDLQNFARGRSTTAPGPQKPSVRSLADMVAIDSSGRLWNYPANGKGGFGSRFQIGSGWTGAKSINPADWDADGTIDLLVQWDNGTLSYYPGRTAGGFDAPVQIGSSGWQDFSLAMGPWVKGQGITIVGAHSDGALYYWPHTSNHRLGSAVRIGSGFTNMPIVMADQNLDGQMDLLSRDSSNNLLRYTASGTGSVVSGSRTVVGTGWDVIDAVNPVDGFNGTSSRGLIGRNTSGNLTYYPFTANGFGAATPAGSGWSSFTVAGTSFEMTAAVPTPEPDPSPAPEPAPEPEPAPAPKTASVRSLADMVAIDSSGNLWNYPASGEGSFGSRFQIGSGWTGIISINPVDWDADGTIDLLAQWDNGTLNYYPGVSSGGFRAPVEIGSSGWQNFSLAVGPWVKGQGVTIVGARADGALYYWPHTAAHALGSAVKIGSGFTDMPIVMADQNLDGRMDLLSRDSNNKNLLRYTGSGTGTIVSGSRTTVGHNWGEIDAVNAVDGFNGTTSRGIIGRSTAGSLTYYPFTASGFGRATPVGSGWSTYTIAGTPFEF